MVGVAGLFEPLRQLLRFGDFALIGQRQRLIDLADQGIQPAAEIFHLRAVGGFALQLRRSALFGVLRGGACFAGSV